MSALRVAAFMSGSGSNLQRILELQKSLDDELFKVVLVFSDTKDESRCMARKIAAEFGVPVIVRDIADFYRERGVDRRDMALRRVYDSITAQELSRLGVELVVLCGYMSIVTEPVYGSFLTINVHPADLSKKSAGGSRVYAGCAGPGCVRKAVLNGDREIRSTVHVVNGEVDGGPIVALSPSVPVTVTGDIVSDSVRLQEELKEKGDWVVLPWAVRMFAEGRLMVKENSVYLDGVLLEDGYRYEKAEA